MYCGNDKTNSPSDYKKVFEQNELNDKVIDKINELVEAVNELRNKNDWIFRKNDLKLKETRSDGKEGFWAMCTNQGKAYWIDYNKVVDKFNEIIEAVNRLEEKANEN